jgi:hypothetical protein
MDGFDLHAAMEWDLRAVLEADAVALLPGWRNSSGTAIELTVANAVGRDVYEYDRNTPGYLSPLVGESVAQEAFRLVRGQRRDDYGHPADNFTQTGRIWGAILNVGDIAPETVGLMMAGAKISRETNVHKRDNLVDLCGYAETVAMVHERGLL